MSQAGLVLVLFGFLLFGGGVFEWRWFMGHRKARVVTQVLGRTGARILYGVLGALFMGWGLLITAGIADLS